MRLDCFAGTLLFACLSVWVGDSVAATTDGGTTNTMRPRARDLGLKVGIFPTGSLNAITDVAGVRVGHVTVMEGDNVRTGVTAILPHSGNLFQEKVPAGIHLGNAFGKLVGYTQVEELGEIETPILLTSTLNVFRAADALVDYTLAQPGNERVRSLNPVVGETNDGKLNDGRGRHVTREHCLEAIKIAAAGPVEEGCVGAGTGTISFEWKGGIGTASRALPALLGGHTLGVLVQSNYGGVLTMNGVPIGQELGQYSYKGDVAPGDGATSATERGDGSIMMVIATDAPVDARNLRRLASRAMLGLGRTGSSGSDGSGDYAIAFTTAFRAGSTPATPLLTNDQMSPLFMAAVEATEEAIYNSMLKATTTTGKGRTVEALPIEELKNILKKYGQH